MIVNWGVSALDDWLEINDYQNTRDPDFPDRLLALAEAAFANIADNPEMYPEVRRGVRKVLLEPTPYLLFYVIVPDGIEVVRLVHGARDWTNQL